MPNGKHGIPTPTRDCVLSWNDFLTHVAGRTYTCVYGIHNHEEIVVPKSFKFKVRWTLNGTFVNRAGITWDPSIKPAPRCDFFQGNFERLDSTTARWRPVSTGKFLTANRTDYFISDNPSEYVIFHICYDPSQNVANKCPISETLLVVRDRRPNVDVNPADGIPDGDLDLTHIDWARIDRKSRSCLGEGLVNKDALYDTFY